MIVKQRGVPPRMQANEVEIILDGVEAGYLRSILFTFTQNDAPSCNSFAKQLALKLDRYDYPEYDKKYPGWRTGLTEK